MSYLDPGTGSFLIQWVIVILLGVIFWMRAHLKRLIGLFRRPRRPGVAETRESKPGERMGPLEGSPPRDR